MDRMHDGGLSGLDEGSVLKIDFARRNRQRVLNVVHAQPPPEIIGAETSRGSGKSTSSLVASRIEGIGPFHCEAVRTDLRGVRRCDTGELCPNVVDDVDVAVRAVVISQTQIGTDRLRI